MEPTLKQSGKILELIVQSGRPAEWVQEHLIGSGAFTDLLAVDDLRGVHRESHRRFLGLPPMTPPLLEPLGTIMVSATTERFSTRDHFVVDTSQKASVMIAWLGSDFTNWFLGKIEEPVVETVLRYAKLIRSSVDGSIFAELGTTAEVMLAQVFALMKRQAKGEDGVLLTNGRVNIFYVRDVTGSLRAVFVYWGGGGWNVNANSVSDPNGWSDGHRVFSRNS